MKHTHTCRQTDSARHNQTECEENTDQCLMAEAQWSQASDRDCQPSSLAWSQRSRMSTVIRPTTRGSAAPAATPPRRFSPFWHHITITQLNGPCKHHNTAILTSHKPHSNMPEHLPTSTICYGTQWPALRSLHTPNSIQKIPYRVQFWMLVGNMPANLATSSVRCLIFTTHWDDWCRSGSERANRHCNSTVSCSTDARYSFSAFSYFFIVKAVNSKMCPMELIECQPPYGSTKASALLSKAQVTVRVKGHQNQVIIIIINIFKVAWIMKLLLGPHRYRRRIHSL